MPSADVEYKFVVIFTFIYDCQAYCQYFVILGPEHCKKSDFLFVKSTGEMLRVKSEMYFLV